ncbi:uncharacterized protein V1513DRAFT_67116 [Lipomyces chichibuensis]|uniref:uncharacterized protein n=1 Tax=Lipomyces chichibuensis TaxID=1546026 RepID=UPI003343D581
MKTFALHSLCLAETRHRTDSNLGDRVHRFLKILRRILVMLVPMFMQLLVNRWTDGDAVLELKLIRLSMTRMQELVAAETDLSSITFSCLSWQLPFQVYLGMWHHVWDMLERCLCSESPYRKTDHGRTQSTLFCPQSCIS